MRYPKKESYDVVVIGGGPAGMMAAGEAARSGASVLLIEKNEGLGKKLLITGGGRCNVTNNKPDIRVFLDELKGKGKFLFSTFTQHSVTDTLEFFNTRGMATKVENEDRVFPVSDSARTVYDVLLKNLKQYKVEILTGFGAKGFHARDGVIVGLNTEKETIVGKTYILATGGTSAPETGSTGDGFRWLEKIGHTVIAPDVALVPVKILEKWVRDLSGVSHQHAKLSIMKNGKRSDSRIGRMIFTHYGMSGPLVLSFSKEIREALHYKQPTDVIELSLDIAPDITNHEDLDIKIQDLFKENSNKKIKNALKGLVQPALSGTVIELAKIDPEKEVNIISRDERLRLGKVLKDMRMTPTGFLGKEDAIVASGGIKLEEVDFKTMQSRLFPNLYLTGDILDIDRPSGGYSLQLCWSTGAVAGKHAASLSQSMKKSQ